MENDQPKILDISWSTILKITIAFLIFYISYLMRDILVWVIFAVIISVLFNPAIDFLRRFMPRMLAAVLVYVTIFGLLAVLIYMVAPIFVSEIQQFSQLFPVYFERVSPIFKGLGVEAFDSFDQFTTSMENWLVGASANIFSALGSIFGGIFSAITIFSIALFLSLEEKGMERIIGLFFSKKYEAFVLGLWSKSQQKVSGWFGTRILGCLFVGLMTFAACYILNIKYAISFAFLAGVLNIIPIIGPVITGVVIAMVVAMTSWLKAAFFLAAFIVIQQIEGNILTPVLTKKFIGLPPALVIVSLLVGGKLWGIMGAILAIPLAGIFFEFIGDFLRRRKEEKTVIL